MEALSNNILWTRSIGPWCNILQILQRRRKYIRIILPEEHPFTSKNLFGKQKLDFSRSALFHIKTRASNRASSLKYFMSDWLWKHFASSNSPQTSSDLICLTLRPLTLV